MIVVSESFPGSHQASAVGQSRTVATRVVPATRESRTVVRQTSVVSRVVAVPDAVQVTVAV